MATRDFILDLGKLMIGIAWIDGRLEHDEINALKELLFLLPDISGEDWMQLELYMTHAVNDAERRDLLDRVLSGIRSSGDKQLVLETLEKLVGNNGADRGVPESAFLEDIRQDIEGRSTGLLGHLTAPIRQTLKRKAGQGAREDRIEDFIKNTIYFQLTSELEQQGRALSIPQAEARKICLAAGLMAHVAWVDNEVCHREREAMSLALRQIWNVPRRRSPVDHRNESRPDHARPGSGSAHQRVLPPHHHRRAQNVSAVPVRHCQCGGRHFSCRDRSDSPDRQIVRVTASGIHRSEIDDPTPGSWRLIEQDSGTAHPVRFLDSPVSFV